MSSTHARRSRTFKIVAGSLAVLGVAVLAIALVVSFNAPNRGAQFRQGCEKSGGTVVVMSSKTIGLAMGAPETHYLLGCRQPGGKITSTYTSSQR
jgi:hypothetical protein